MLDRWLAPETYYSHGFLVPLISLYMIWTKKDSLSRIEFSASMSGLFIAAAGLVAHIVSAALRIYFISGFSFVFVLFGLILFFVGKKTARELLFPVGFLFTMIPLPLVLIGNLTVKLKLLVAQLSAVSLF